MRELGHGYLYQAALYVVLVFGAWYFGPVGGVVVALIFIVIIVWRLVRAMRDV